MYLIKKIRMKRTIPCLMRISVGSKSYNKLSFCVGRSPSHFSLKDAGTSFEVKPYKLHKLDKGPSTTVQVTHEDALQLYEKIMYLRQMETATANLYRAQMVRGFCHLYIGQEAVAVGLCSVLRATDTLITSYRCHGITYLMGASIQGVLGELCGKKSGVSRGKGGSMHMFSKNFYGGTGIVGCTGPLGAGLAFSHKYKGDGGVCFAMYGDGAANQGQLYEAFNMAKLMNLPCIFLCENNIYGLGTSAKRSSGSTDYYKRGDYIPGIWVDGMDVLATREAAKYAIDHCTSDKGPIVVEMETYRFMGHSMSDPGTSYRTREEVQEARQTRCPLITFREKLLSAKLITKEQLEAVKKKVDKDVKEAVKLVKSDTEADIDEAAADIYVRNLHESIRGTHVQAPYKHIEIAERKKES